MLQLWRSAGARGEGQGAAAERSEAAWQAAAGSWGTSETTPTECTFDA